jgi:hypothetical protein
VEDLEPVQRPTERSEFPRIVEPVPGQLRDLRNAVAHGVGMAVEDSSGFHCGTASVEPRPKGVEQRSASAGRSVTMFLELQSMSFRVSWLSPASSIKAGAVS